MVGGFLVGVGEYRWNAEKCNSSQIYTKKLNHIRNVSFEKTFQDG